MNTPPPRPMFPGRTSEPPPPPRSDEPRSSVTVDGSAAAAGASNRKIMVVGPGINLNGEMRSCDQLVVQGNVEGKLTECAMLTVAQSGSFKGDAETDGAEVDGRFQGKMMVRGRLVIRATGRVTGEISYGQVEIERGGEISGTVTKMDGVGD